MKLLHSRRISVEPASVVKDTANGRVTMSTFSGNRTKRQTTAR
jgi:hypothetical protein